MQINFNFHQDAGHGWLAVSTNILKEYGKDILEEITNYSYYSNKSSTVYLEEDCDAGLFLKELDKRGIKFKLNVVDDGQDSFIRRMDRFSKFFD